MPSSRYTGDSKVNVVPTEPSSDMFTFSGFFVTIEKGNVVLPGYPFTTSLISTETGNDASFVLKNNSRDVTIIPPSASTKKVSANGSIQPSFVLSSKNLLSSSGTSSLSNGGTGGSTGNGTGVGAGVGAGVGGGVGAGGGGGGGGGIGVNSSSRSGGVGGEGGAGQGGDNTGSSGSDATDGTGSGGGGRGYYNAGSGRGGNGGDGLVIFRYPDNKGQKGSGGTVVQSGGWYYHTFTSGGTFTA